MGDDMTRCARSLIFLACIAPALAAAAPTPVTVAACGDSRVEVTPGAQGGTPSLNAVIVSGAIRWSFTASVGLVRLGAKTRTITVEELHTQDRTPAARAKDATPAALVLDLLLEDNKLVLRHASEGGADPAYAVDLGQCRFDNDAALAGLQPPPVEPVGCAPAVIAAGYRTQIAQAAQLADADATREAQALCEDHQKTIEARTKLEQALSDRAARERSTTRGAALLRVEQARLKAWRRLDACLGADLAKARGVAALRDREAKLRACYARLAAKP
jgi:hypothetical protein